MKLSCSLPPSTDIADLAELAEGLGYSHLYLYDSPALYCDVWMSLMQVAARTQVIGLGPGVLVPSLRHPMAIAAAIATLVAAAPGRVGVAIGSGFTGRMALGRKPLPWGQVESYVRTLRVLLRGEQVEWDGSWIRMLHSEGFGAARPIKVPILIAGDGPKGCAVAEAVGDGIISLTPMTGKHNLQRRVLMQIGTVLDDGETPESDRVRSAVAPGVLFSYHAAYAHKGAEAVLALPGGEAWVSLIEKSPEETRHLAVHEGHATKPNAADRVVLEHCAPLIAKHTMTANPAGIRKRIDDLAAKGITEIVYQASGPDIERELVTMARAVGIAPRCSTTAAAFSVTAEARSRRTFDGTI